MIAHGNTETGMGHVMRALSLAEAFRSSGHSVSFFSKYPPGAEIIKGKGFDVLNWEKAGEWKDTKDFPADVIVIDSYEVSREYFEKLKERTKCLVYIDDLNAFKYPVDVIVNGTASALNMNYEALQDAKLLLGLRYNLLRKEFFHVPKRKTGRKINNILITTGNSDPFHMTEKILQIFIEEKEFAGLKYHVIVGSGFDNNIWESRITDCADVCLYKNPDMMSEIMMNCDVAVAAGGSTLYELAACGIPAVVFAYAENQIPQITAMEQENLIRYLGTYTSVKKERLIKEIQYFQENIEMREELVKKLQKLVDAQGSLRVVKEIEAVIEEMG